MVIGIGVGDGCRVEAHMSLHHWSIGPLHCNPCSKLLLGAYLCMLPCLQHINNLQGFLPASPKGVLSYMHSIVYNMPLVASQV